MKNLTALTEILVISIVAGLFVLSLSDLAAVFGHGWAIIPLGGLMLFGLERVARNIWNGRFA